MRLPREHLDIVASWRHLIHGKFLILRELAKYTVFLSIEPPAAAYGVVALTQPFDDFFGRPFPVMVQTTLLPFKNRIVYDGLLSSFNIVFGAGARRGFDVSYKAAKARHGIVTLLPIGSTPAVKAAQAETRAKRSK